jgi:hypothetical protein
VVVPGEKEEEDKKDLVLADFALLFGRARRILAHASA